MNRIEYINKIVKYASIFVHEVEGFNALNQYHINIHAESFLVPVLNEILGLSLENLNTTQRKNFPAIDLADFSKRVAFQITSSSTSEKIYDTLRTFFKHELNKNFDSIYFYIITHKKENLSEKKLNEIIPKGFAFTATDNIIDISDILKRIDAITSTSKIEHIAKLYELEFSDVQVELRKQKFQAGYLNNDPEMIFPNLLKISFPKFFFKAELNIDEKKLAEEINEFHVGIGRRNVKRFQKAKLIKYALKKLSVKCDDWILFENWIYSFRDFSDIKEPINKIIDVGTVTEVECQDFYDGNEDNANVFKHLLRNTFGEFCKTKGIEWFGRKHIFRFANNPKNPSSKQIKWKGKKEATRTVIAEIRNKKDDHLICYRNLAFRCSFINIDKEWFIIINPTWSFTNPGGYLQSRFEPAYMSGIKRLENNSAVYNYYRIFGYYFSYFDLFSKTYPFIDIKTILPLTMSPSLEENTWIPIKIPNTVKDLIDVDIQKDNELFDNSYFE
ncbi:MAG: SMEK domain-containing protein [Bacteroidales bacterium]